MDTLAQLNVALGGRYAIEREIGRGGMATVYLARDIKHDRRVALKVLNPELGAVLGAERFLSEIRVTANLQHPNLLPLFDSGEAEGLLFYVMPYVEGESLRRRLDRERQLPVDEAIRIAVAIADALDYAHKHGVVHRDLKPENILLQHGQPVIADFGIALAVSNAGGARVTQTGISLGTPQYMSPEQATGDRVIDARSDIYSLGAVTYEMLAGEPAHAGSTAQAIIARLMTEVPRPLTVLRHTVPQHVDDAVNCALEKLPADRFATAKEFADALRGTGASPIRTHHTKTISARMRSRTLMYALGGAGALILLLGALLWRAESRPEPGTIRFVLDLPEDQRIRLANSSSVALSHDGRTIAYVAMQPDGIRRIFVRRLDSLRAWPLPGSEGGQTPLFSPDGRWIAFKTQTDIRKVPLGGGGAEIIAPAVNWQGFAWGPGGEIALALEGSIWLVGDKGERKRLTTPDTVGGEIGHAGPWFLDRNTIAFVIQKPTADETIRGVGLTTLAGGKHTLLDIPGDSPLGYVEGHLLLSHQSGTLLAYPIDLRRKRVTGPSVAVLDSVVWIAAGGLQASVARGGALAYIRGSSRRRLAIVDARGNTVAETPELRDYGAAVLSPDGRRVAVQILRSMVGGRNVANSDIWIWDLDSKSLVPLTTDGGLSPAWTPDGKRVAYLRPVGRGQYEAWWAPVDGSTPPERFMDFATVRPLSFSFTPSGRSIVVLTQDSTTQGDIYIANFGTSDTALVPLVRTKFTERPGGVSPDGRWLAYTSNQTGRLEVYVRPLAGTTTAVRVSTGGGDGVQWATGGRRLVYSEGSRTIAATLALSESSFRVTRQDTITVDGRRQDIDPRTDRILVSRDPNDPRIVVVQNWFAEVKAKLKRGGR